MSDDAVYLNASGARVASPAERRAGVSYPVAPFTSEQEAYIREIAREAADAAVRDYDRSLSEAVGVNNDLMAAFTQGRFAGPPGCSTLGASGREP